MAPPVFIINRVEFRYADDHLNFYGALNLGILNFGHSHLLHLVGLFLGDFRAWCDLICPQMHLSF